MDTVTITHKEVTITPKEKRLEEKIGWFNEQLKKSNDYFFASVSTIKTEAFENRRGEQIPSRTEEILLTLYYSTSKTLKQSGAGYTLEGCCASAAIKIRGDCQNVLNHAEKNIPNVTQIYFSQKDLQNSQFLFDQEMRRLITLDNRIKSIKLQRQYRCVFNNEYLLLACSHPLRGSIELNFGLSTTYNILKSEKIFKTAVSSLCTAINHYMRKNKQIINKTKGDES